MSQQKQIKTDKAKQLRAVRQRLAWTQQQMAEALGLDPSYLSQLENGRRKLDDWYLKKAGEFERSKAMAESPPLQPTATSCLAHLKQFLATCKDATQITWTHVELLEHFPLDKWTSAEAEMGPEQPLAAATLAPKPDAPPDRERRTP
jgi:transcriptional regulator with XRE-family HTH domain